MNFSATLTALAPLAFVLPKKMRSTRLVMLLVASAAAAHYFYSKKKEGRKTRRAPTLQSSRSDSALLNQGANAVHANSPEPAAQTGVQLCNDAALQSSADNQHSEMVSEEEVLQITDSEPVPEEESVTISSEPLLVDSSETAFHSSSDKDSSIIEPSLEKPIVKLPQEKERLVRLDVEKCEWDTSSEDLFQDTHPWQTVNILETTPTKPKTPKKPKNNKKTKKAERPVTPKRPEKQNEKGKLNVNAKEFRPRSNLNLNASPFYPTQFNIKH